MISGKRVLAIVPARGGSKGIALKNIATCAGKPLIAWTLAAARSSKYIDQTIVTTDSLEISQVAMRYGCGASISRPAALATDDARMEGVVNHALGMFPGYDVAVLLQPTSPLRTGGDIDAALELLASSPRCIAFGYSKGTGKCSQCKRSVAGAMWSWDGIPKELYPLCWECFNRLFDRQKCGPINETPCGNSVVSVHESYAVPFTGEDPPPRQQRKPTLLLNGAIYAFRVQWYLKNQRFVAPESVPYVMPAERAVDVDYPLDLALAALLIGTTGSDAPVG